MLQKKSHMHACERLSGIFRDLDVQAAGVHKYARIRMPKFSFVTAKQKENVFPQVYDNTVSLN